MATVSERAPAGNVLLLGGRSEIGLEVAVRLAPGRVVVLAARDSATLDAEERSLLAAGATAVHRLDFDADDLDRQRAVLDRARELVGALDVVLVAFGVLGDQARAESDAAHAAAIAHTDYLAQVTVLTHLAAVLREQRSGDLVVFSSVAGVRVRRANYVYGSAKAGLDGFASGLADALHGSGVRLLLVRPGFVIGRMTEGMSPAPFSSTPAQVADAVVAGLQSSRQVVWVPGILRWIAVAMRVAPRALWRRLPR